MEQHEKVYRTRKKIAIDNFIGGIAWSIGVLVGGTIVVALLGFVLGKVNLIPVIGDFVSQITMYVQNNSQLLK